MKGENIIIERVRKWEKRNEDMFNRHFGFLDEFTETLLRAFKIDKPLKKKLNDNEKLAWEFEDMLLQTSFENFFAAICLIRARYSGNSLSCLRNLLEAVLIIEYLVVNLDNISIKDFIEKWEDNQSDLLRKIGSNLKEKKPHKFENMQKLRKEILNEYSHCNYYNVIGNITTVNGSYAPKIVAVDRYNYIDGIALTFSFILLLELLDSEFSFSERFVEIDNERELFKQLGNRLREEILPEISRICPNELPDWIKDRL